MRSTTRIKRSTAKREVTKKARSGDIAVETADMAAAAAAEEEEEVTGAAAVEEITTECQ
jgi:hypothetical protein